MKRAHFSTAQPVNTFPPEHFRPGVGATKFDPGDFVLVKGKGLQGSLIKFGQQLRIHGADRKYVDWSHAALIVDRVGGLIEAVGKGVRKATLDDYIDRPYQVYRIKASDEDREQVVAFARWALQEHAKYGPLTIASIALSMLTGSKLRFSIDGQFVCSGLVASALQRTGSIFDRSATHIAPADLAKYFDPDQRPYLAESGTSFPDWLSPSVTEASARTVRTS